MNIIFKPECKTEIIKPTYDLPIIGEPISKTGASANNSDAYGVIVGIIGDGSSRRVRVMTEGYIDYDKVKDNYMEYTDEAINALTGITLCSGGKLPTGGGSGGVTTLHINVPAINMETKEATFTADKTPAEMEQAAVNGPVWCVVTFAAGLMGQEAVSVGVPPTWYSLEPAFGGGTALVHNENGNNKIGYAVRRGGSNSWIVDLTQFGG